MGDRSARASATGGRLSVTGQVQEPVVLKSPFEKKQDVFDQENFDAISFINQIYPDDSSLSDLDKFIEVLKRQVRTVDRDIFNAVRSQGPSQQRARQDLSMAHSQIEELFTKITHIQQQAEESEAMVQEICRDIKKLDYAKKHLTQAITSLRRLAMLTAAVTDLETAAQRRDQYRKCANLIEAVQQLMEYFEPYQAIPKVRDLNRRLQIVRESLQVGVLDDFKILMGTADQKLTGENLERLANACLVVNALGPKVRDQMMDWLCDREMTIYQAIFSMSNQEANKLDRFERRFQWFKSRLEEKKEQWALFPEHWRVPQVLCLTFCKITKAHLKRVLSDDDSALGEDIGPLIKTVAATNKFEKEMAALFGGSTHEEDEEELEQTDEMSASEARKRLEKFRHKALHKAQEETSAGEKAEADAVTMAFEGSISDAFEHSLRYYAAEEEKELLAVLETGMKEEHERKWSPAEEEVGPGVLQSANQLFFKIRGSFTRCVRLISRGQTLLNLAAVFKRVLYMYANELMKRLPKTTSGHTNASPPFISSEWHIKVSEEDERVICHILHTAEFCRETIEGLAAAMQKDIKPALAEQVDFSDEEGVFMNVTSACLSVLVLGVNTRLDAALQDMLRIRWDTFDSPGDDSAFVGMIRKVLVDCAPRLGGELDKGNVGFFCDKMVRMFVPRFQESVYKLKRISNQGIVQLSIDADSIKRILHDFPNAALPHDPDMPSYQHYVDREMGFTVNLIKVMQARAEILVDTYQLLMPPQSQNVAEFLRVCELKGVPKKQQLELSAQFQQQLAKSGVSDSSSSAQTAPLPSTAAAALPNLGAFKLNMNQFTRDLASSIPFQKKTGEPTMPIAMVGTPKGGKPLDALRGAMQDLTLHRPQLGEKTKENLAKFGTLLRTGMGITGMEQGQ